MAEEQKPVQQTPNTPTEEKPATAPETNKAPEAPAAVPEVKPVETTEKKVEGAPVDKPAETPKVEDKPTQ